MAKTEKLTDHQREELARFVEKMNTLVPSEQQELIFERAKTNTGRYVINAGPGSGKTTTAIKLSTFFTDSSSIYFSFNKKIQVDTTRKLNALGSKMTASTVHSFGLMCMNDYFGKDAKCQMKNSKYEDIIEAQIARYWNGFFQSIKSSLTKEQLEKSSEWLYDTRTWCKTLIKYHQLSLSGLDPISLQGLIEQFDLTDISIKSPIWPFVVATTAQTVDEGKKQFWDNHFIDFNDMIYYPAIFSEIPVQTYKHVIIDEAQDTSETGLTLILRACEKDTQVFAIGDPRQSIYLFAGAKPESIPDIIHSLKAEVLPLRTCYRCGSKIVDLANQLDGQLIAAGKHEGNVKVIASEEYLAQLQPKDAVIGRTTARLVKDCLRVLQTGKRALVLGKNIGDSISGIITKIEARRISRGISTLAYDLSNFIELLDQHMNEQIKIINETRKKNPELAVSELQDKVDTAKAFYEAYVTKCIDANERRETDPHCEYDQTAKDFKRYIRGLFTDDENETIIQFMTAHRSKGLEFERVFIIGTEEFPHPKAKSNQQQRQEQNIMYVAITRAINDLYFVDAPFTSVSVPGYNPHTGGLTIISIPHADILATYPRDSERDEMHHDKIEVPEYNRKKAIARLIEISKEQSYRELWYTARPGESVKVPNPKKEDLRSWWEDTDDEEIQIALANLEMQYGDQSPKTIESTIVQETHHDEIQVVTSATINGQPIRDIIKEIPMEPLREETIKIPRQKTENPYLSLPPSTIVENSDQAEPPLIKSKKQDAFVGKLLALEVLCPSCGNDCADPKTGSIMITQDLIGHTVQCIECHTESLVPLNAFSLTTDVIAREKPTSNGPHNKNDKKGRTQKENKSTRGRKAKSGVVRQPRQLSLDVRTIQTLDAMKANNSELFETLLNQYEPFLNTWTKLGYGSYQENEDE